MLSHHYKLTIVMIDQQMKEFEFRKSSEEYILKVLKDFIPDVTGILANAGKKELKKNLKAFPYFGKFADLVQGKKTKKSKVTQRKS